MVDFVLIIEKKICFISCWVYRYCQVSHVVFWNLSKISQLKTLVCFFLSSHQQSFFTASAGDGAFDEASNWFECLWLVFLSFVMLSDGNGGKKIRGEKDGERGSFFGNSHETAMPINWTRTSWVNNSGNNYNPSLGIPWFAMTPSLNRPPLRLYFCPSVIRWVVSSSSSPHHPPLLFVMQSHPHPPQHTHTYFFPYFSLWGRKFYLLARSLKRPLCLPPFCPTVNSCAVAFSGPPGDFCAGELPRWSRSLKKCRTCQHTVCVRQKNGALEVSF